MQNAQAHIFKLFAKPTEKQKANDDGYARTENLADSDQYGRDAFIVYSALKQTKTATYFQSIPQKIETENQKKKSNLTWNAESGRIYPTADPKNKTNQF